MYNSTRCFGMVYASAHHICMFVACHATYLCNIIFSWGVPNNSRIWLSGSSVCVWKSLCGYTYIVHLIVRVGFVWPCNTQISRVRMRVKKACGLNGGDAFDVFFGNVRAQKHPARLWSLFSFSLSLWRSGGFKTHRAKAWGIMRLALTVAH